MTPSPSAQMTPPTRMMSLIHHVTEEENKGSKDESGKRKRSSANERRQSHDADVGLTNQEVRKRRGGSVWWQVSC